MSKSVLLASNMYKPNIGGVENSLYHLAKGYLELGYRSIICASDIGPSGKTLVPFEIEEEIEVYRYQVNEEKGGKRFFAHWLRALELFKALKVKYQPDIIICRNHQICLILKLAGFKNINYIVPGVVKYQNSNKYLKHGSVTTLSKVKIWLKTSLSRIIQYQSFFVAKRIFVFSENMLEQVGTVSSLVKKRISIVKPGVDSQRFTCLIGGKKQQAREDLNLVFSGPVFLCIGRFVAAKGFDLVIDAMNFVPNSRLWIVGDGVEKTNYAKRIMELGLEKRIKVIPSNPKPELYYSAADFFIMSSRYEPLGQTIIEALASGLPIVAFDENTQVVTATSELLGKSGAFYAEELCHLALAKKMEEAIETYNSPAYQALSNTNREKALAGFRWLSLCKSIERAV